MPRLMSVALTEDAVRARTKTETRRVGWRTLTAGDTLDLVRKSMGRHNRATGVTEPLVYVARVCVYQEHWERLGIITPAAVRREGFPDWTPAEFIAMFCDTHRGVTPTTEVHVIRWEYL